MFGNGATAIQTTVFVYAYLNNGKQGHKRDANEWRSWRGEEAWEFRWLTRKGPFCFSAPSLQPFVNFHHSITSLPLQHSLLLEYLFECLFCRAQGQSCYCVFAGTWTLVEWSLWMSRHLMTCKGNMMFVQARVLEGCSKGAYIRIDHVH